MLKSMKRIKNTVKTAPRISVLYAVFDKKTEKFLGVGDFTSSEIRSLENDYIFSRI